MGVIKKIWRDNTMPPKNYVWMKTDPANKKVIGVYEYLNGAWREIHIGDGSVADAYSKAETDEKLRELEDRMIELIEQGQSSIIIDSTIDTDNAVQGRVIKNELDKKLDKSAYIPVEDLMEIFV